MLCTHVRISVSCGAALMLAAEIMAVSYGMELCLGIMCACLCVCVRGRGGGHGGSREGRIDRLASLPSRFVLIAPQQPNDPKGKPLQPPQPPRCHRTASHAVLQLPSESAAPGAFRIPHDGVDGVRACGGLRGGAVHLQFSDLQWQGSCRQ